MSLSKKYSLELIYKIFKNTIPVLQKGRVYVSVSWHNRSTNPKQRKSTRVYQEGETKVLGSYNM